MKKIEQDVRDFISDDYPCTPAILALKQGSLIIREIDSQIGDCTTDLREHLDEFIERYEHSKEPYLSLWLSWDTTSLDEAEFERRMWVEIKSFCPSLPVSYRGHQLFIVGLHPGASRKARRFSRCSIVINSFKQFERIEEAGNYKVLVDNIRKRDVKYSGSINPTVEKYADVWEEVQFSGRENDDDWEIP